jgi:hypothetical protein
MAVLLLVPYGGSPAGSVVSLTAELEAALIAQRLATTSAAALTTGNVTPTGAAIPSIPEIAGIATAAPGASTVTITNSGITANSKVQGFVQQATADATALSVVRTSAAAGVATLYLTAAATAATTVSYAIYN